MHYGMPVSSSRCKTWYFSHFHVHWEMYSEFRGLGGEHALQSEQVAGRETRSEPCGQGEHRRQRGVGVYTCVYAGLHASSQLVPFQKLLHHTRGPQLSHLVSCVTVHARTCLYPVQSVHRSQRASLRAVPATLNCPATHRTSECGNKHRTPSSPK